MHTSNFQQDIITLFPRYESEITRMKTRAFDVGVKKLHMFAHSSALRIFSQNLIEKEKQKNILKRAPQCITAQIFKLFFIFSFPVFTKVVQS
jgi:hypothetical protein